MNEQEELLVAAAAEGLYDGHLDWPALLAEEEIDRRARCYAAERSLAEENAALFAIGYVAAYGSVEQIGRDEPETISDRAALLLSMSRKNGLAMCWEAARRILSTRLSITLSRTPSARPTDEVP